MRGRWDRVLAVVTFAFGVGPSSAGAQAPEVLGAGTISTEAIEYGPAFTPSGDTLYFTRRASFREPPKIYWTARTADGWTSPEVVTFGSEHGDEYPSVSADGRRIYFASARPVSGLEPRERNDLWVVERGDGGWGAARHLGGDLSTSGVESHPLEAHGGLYFHSSRSGGAGQVDAWFARGGGRAFGVPEPLPFNSPETDGEVVPAPDGGVVFYSDRPGGAGRGDLYYVARSDDGWGEPVNLGAPVNTDAWEWTPAFTPDGRLVFARLNGEGSRSDLYVSEFRVP